MIPSGGKNRKERARGLAAAVDPAAKIAAAILFSAGVCLLREIPSSALSCVFPALLLASSGAPPSAVKRLVPVNLFFLFLWVTLPLSLAARPDTFASLGPLHFRKAGLVLAAVITLKGNAAALAIIALIDSSPVTANARALLRLKTPRKFVTLLLLTHANLHLMRREAARLFQAAKLRGFTPRCSLGFIRTYAWLTGMVLIRSWQRARNVGDSMKLRSFAGLFPLVETETPAPNPAAAFLLIALSAGVPALMHLYERAGEHAGRIL